MKPLVYNYFVLVQSVDTRRIEGNDKLVSKYNQNYLQLVGMRAPNITNTHSDRFMVIVLSLGVNN